MNLYSFEVHTIDGNLLDWSALEGKKILIVNTASQCGLTPQYRELEELYEKYHSKGFTILGFPSNDFGAQEPGTNAEIAEFCSQNYGVTFPMMSKISVIGEEQHPLYFWLTNETNESVSWNFQKFLINEFGEVVESIEPSISPLDPHIIAWIESH
jgi:glutathione peroxidase